MTHRKWLPLLTSAALGSAAQTCPARKHHNGHDMKFVCLLQSLTALLGVSLLDSGLQLSLPVSGPLLTLQVPHLLLHVLRQPHDQVCPASSQSLCLQKVEVHRLKNHSRFRFPFFFLFFFLI